MHTPGPWNMIKHDERDSRVGSNTLLAIVYSTAFGDTENQRANAHLIAAAPELLDALKATLGMLTHERELCPQTSCARCHAEQAIAKAERR